MSQTDRNRAARALLGVLTGKAMGVVVNSAVLPDTRKLLEQKGYLVKGADVLNTEYMVLVGPMAHCVPKGLPPRMAVEMHEVFGVMFVEMTSDELHRGLEKQPDAKQPEYYPEMKATVDKLQQLADLVNGKRAEVEKEEQEDTHANRLCIGAELPSGKTLQAVFCRDCAMEFIEGRSEGKEYKKVEFLRLLMAYVIAASDDQHAERVINEKAIKATMEARDKAGKPH